MTWSIRDRATFAELRANGRRAHRGALSVTYLSTVMPAPTRARVAFAVSRRVGSAVVRNRVRRRLRAALRELATAEPELLRPGAHLLAASPHAANKTYSELRTDLAAALRKLHRPAEQPRDAK